MATGHLNVSEAFPLYPDSPSVSTEAPPNVMVLPAAPSMRSPLSARLEKFVGFAVSAPMNTISPAQSAPDNATVKPIRKFRPPHTRASFLKQTDGNHTKNVCVCVELYT